MLSKKISAKNGHQTRSPARRRGPIEAQSQEPHRGDADRSQRSLRLAATAAGLSPVYAVTIARHPPGRRESKLAVAASFGDSFRG